MKPKKVYRAEANRQLAAQPKRDVRKHLNADALMASLAMFQLKEPSLLAFDKCRREEPENLRTIWKRHV